MLKINLPHSMWEYKISGVYRILFTDGSFYIGCSNNMRSRASCWDSIFRTGKGIPGETIGTNMLNKILEEGTAEFNIIELCSPVDLKDKEALYLFENKENPLMLSSWDMGAWRPVLQYKSDTGLFIKRHVSISSAAKYISSRVGHIQRVLSGERTSHKGMTFSYEADYLERRKKIIKRRYAKADPKRGRDLIMYDLNNKEVMRFKMIKEAASHVKVNKTGVTRVLSGHQKTAGGYIFKYA